MRQQEWKIERMIKENRALELQNVELRKQAQDVKSENLEVRCNTHTRTHRHTHTLIWGTDCTRDAIERQP